MNHKGKHILSILIAFAAVQPGLSAQQISSSWNPDKGTHYVNPVLNADYSDPDVCRGYRSFIRQTLSIGRS